jgi:hypothetical protein
MTGSLPRDAPCATGMTKAVARRREYSKRWRDRVQWRGVGDGLRHEWRSKAGTGAAGRVWGEPPKPSPAGLPRSGTPRAVNAGEAVEPHNFAALSFSE